MVANVAHRSDAGLVSRKISNEAELQQEFAALETKALQTTNGSATISVEKYFAARLRGNPRGEVRRHLRSGNPLRAGGHLYRNPQGLRAATGAADRRTMREDMLSSLKAFPILEKAAALDLLTDALLRLSDLAVELSGKITAVDINPIGLRAHSSEALVLDAKIHISERRST